MGISLISGEKVIHQTAPHFLAMLHLYLIWVYVGMLGFLTMLWRSELTRWIHGFPRGEQLEQVFYFALWSLVLLIPSFVLAVFRINWRWILLAVLLSGGGIAVHVYEGPIFHLVENGLDSWRLSRALLAWVSDAMPWHAREGENYLLILVALLGIVGSNSYRRAHRYYVTNRRIIICFGFIAKRERDILYSKIEDLILHQSFLGSIFGFGTLIPISASGIGTGQDSAFVSGEAGMKLPKGPTISVQVGGGKSVTVPRAPSFYSLYGVKKPSELKECIIQQMEEREYGHTRRSREAQQEQERR